jgi:Arc/MetJ-type ribon-helix-helix transcriptional regulator
MVHELSPQTEQYLEQVVALGLYASKEAALEAAVVALREKDREIPWVPEEHMEAVEQGLAEADAGLCQPMTEEDWAELRKLAEDVAAGLDEGVD